MQFVSSPAVIRLQSPVLKRKRSCSTTCMIASSRVSTTDKQWANFAKNTGTWEGSLTTYDGSAVEQDRQPTVLFIEAEGGAANDLPFALQLLLRRPSKLSDVRQIYMRGEDLSMRGMVFDDNRGSMCCGSNLAPARVIEQNLNFDGGRARLVTQYNFDGNGISKFSLFRERPSEQKRTQDIKDTQVDAHVVNSDAPWLTDRDTSSTLDQGLESFAGNWKATEVLFIRANGNTENVQGSSELELRMEDASTKGTRQVKLGDGTILSTFGGGVASRVSQKAPHNGEDSQIELLLLRGSTLQQIRREYRNGRFMGSHFCFHKRSC